MRIGIKSGCFTLIHAGHIWCLQECKKYCDMLIVLTNDDSYIFRKKGSCPLSLHDRMFILSNIKGVDCVSFFTEDTEHEWIKRYKQAVLSTDKIIVFHSDELKGLPDKEIPGYGLADEFVFIPKVDRPESVTKIYNEIRGVNG